MIVYNNETIKNLIIDALDKKEKGIEISEVDRNELINVILKYGDRDFGIKNKDTGKYYTEEELQYSVYIHIVNENNKCYIGQTSMKPRDRWRSDGSGYEAQVFYNAIKYYGWDNISHIVLCYGLSEEEVNKMEIALISLFKSTNREEFGYNVANGGDSKGKHSEETRKKISEANKGENHHMYNKHHSEETRKKLSEAKKGENHHFYGKKHSKETRNKISEAKKGRFVGEKSPLYRIPRSDETKKKISEANKGENNPKAKKVYCNGKIFSTIKQCAKFYNMNYSTMMNWLRTNKITDSKFIELGLRYATQEDINTYPLYIEESKNEINEAINVENNYKAKVVFFNGMIFSTVKQFAKFCNVSTRTMSDWLNGKYKRPSKLLSKLLEQGLRFATQEDIEKYPPYIEE